MKYKIILIHNKKHNFINNLPKYHKYHQNSKFKNIHLSNNKLILHNPKHQNLLFHNKLNKSIVFKLYNQIHKLLYKHHKIRHNNKIKIL